MLKYSPWADPLPCDRIFLQTPTLGRPWRRGLACRRREGGGGASGGGEGAAFPKRLRRKNYVRRSPLSNGENSYLKTHARAFESCWLMSTAHVYRLSPILRLLSLYFSKRTNDRTSITGSTGSSPSGSGLHRLAYRRKRDRLRPRNKPLWDTAAGVAAATDPAGKSGGRNPRPWRRACGERSPRRWPRGWPMHAHRPRS